MTEDILSQASSWGFICECNQMGIWRILPFQTTQRWELQQVEDNRWLLMVGGVSQVNLQPSEAIAFLERRRMS